MSRHKARDAAMKVLYRFGITGNSDIPNIDESLFSLEKLSDNDKSFLKSVICGFEANKAQVDNLISENLKGWSFDRISKVDLAILRLAITESQYLDTPVKVAVNEAVEMAKLYSDEKSYKFINGLLANAIKTK